LIELDEFEAYFQQELPKVIQSHRKNEVCKDQTCFGDTLKTVQYFHGMVLSNYRSQLASELTTIDSNSTSSTLNPSAPINSTYLPSAPTESDGTSCITSQSSADTAVQAFEWDTLQAFFEVPTIDFTSPCLPGENEDTDIWQNYVLEPFP
jgi:hypothetical protein